MVIVTQTLNERQRARRSAAGGLAQEKPSTPADPSPISTLNMLVFITGDTCFVAVLKIIRPTAEAELLFFFFFLCLSASSTPNYPVIATDQALFTCDYDFGFLSSGDKEA